MLSLTAIDLFDVGVEKAKRMGIKNINLWADGFMVGAILMRSAAQRGDGVIGLCKHGETFRHCSVPKCKYFSEPPLGY